MSDNGHSAHAHVLTLTFDATTFQLRIDGNVANFDMARAMLAQADRWFEQQQRLASIAQAQQAAQQAARDAAIAEQLRASGAKMRGN